MLYSCFNPASGLYDYFQDGKQLAINADLPVPKLPPMAGKIGVPAINAGRPLPQDAKPAGQGWHAKGLIVQCGRGALGASDGTPSEGWDWFKSGGWKWVLGGAVAIWIVRRI